MIRKGDFNGDGSLTQEEFCILVIQASLIMMAEVELWLENTLNDEILADLMI